MNQARLIVILLGTIFFLLGELPGRLPAAEMPPAVSAFFQTHCLRCHNDKKPKGEFRLDTLSLDFVDNSAAQKWAEVMTRINAGEMPPKKETQPRADEVGKVADWISGQIQAGQAARMAKRGPVAHYRLSREEYANTVYDLLGVHFDVNLPGALNEDPRWHGFERIGSMLSLSPSHVERYFKAAETVVDRAFPEQLVKTVQFRADAIEMRHRDQRKRLEEMGLAKQVRAVVWPGDELPAFRSYWGGAPRQPGIYRAKIQLSGLQPRNGRAPHLAIWNPSLKRTIYDEDIIAPEGKPIIVEFETFLSLPAELNLLNDVARPIPEGHTRNVLAMGGNIFTSSKDSRFLNPTGYKLTEDDGTAIYPLLLVDWIEWEGPLLSKADEKKRAGLYPAKEGDLVQTRECLKRFAQQAWRRPASDAEIDRYVKIVKSELEAGEKFRSAYLTALVGILSSKNFYYIEEGSAGERRDRLNDWELASRLSYFLWGSMPDDDLFAAAQTGTLSNPKVLQTQVARMLAGPKISRFHESFPRQWLQLYKVGMFPPDVRLYPDYDKWLEKSMVLETTNFFAEVFAKNLSLREFLECDWAMINPRLALHYNLPALSQSGFQKIKLRPEDHRGGLLTQAAILSLTSDGSRHRPVHRGVWISEAIFGKTPPPPPPNVEPLAPTPVNKPKATIRMQLEAHATHATCASCHRKIDSLGFAFDNYDAIGRWRTEEIMTAGQGGNPLVNAGGMLPDGRAFKGPDDFKQLLVQDLDRFAEAFVENLATYALRRVMTIDDAKQIKALTLASKKDGYKLRTVLENLLQSELFLKR